MNFYRNIERKTYSKIIMSIMDLPQDNLPPTQKFFVYLLVSSDGATYIGATVDLNRRLRQHNKEISGGAHLTGIKIAKGEIWTRAAYVEGFPSWQAALQFEWRWKQISRKLMPRMNPLHRRMVALHTLLSLDRPTTKAVPYAEWHTLPNIVFEIDEAKTYYPDTKCAGGQI